MLHFGPVQSALSYPFSPLLLSYGPVPVERGSALVTCLSLFIHCATTTRSLSLYSRLNGQPHIEVTSRRTAPSFCFAFVNAVVIPGKYLCSLCKQCDSRVIQVFIVPCIERHDAVAKDAEDAHCHIEALANESPNNRSREIHNPPLQNSCLLSSILSLPFVLCLNCSPQVQPRISSNTPFSLPESGHKSRCKTRDRHSTAAIHREGTY